MKAAFKIAERVLPFLQASLIGVVLDASTRRAGAEILFNGASQGAQATIELFHPQ